MSNNRRVDEWVERMKMDIRLPTIQFLQGGGRKENCDDSIQRPSTCTNGRVDVKHKSTEDKVRREKVFEVDEALDDENSKGGFFSSEEE
ncbi:hypothetical protein Tco_0726108 [Tanacetum coccineum]|uniref:Uncharacterized protein n=1 Tax=Tanacetum coccineum TaxID=301880 RepID=A0ABQ4YH68_9ASTR